MDTKTKRTTMFIVGIAVVVTVLGTISYAFFSSTGESTPQQATISTGTARVTFSNNDTGITGQLAFGESITTKTFTIENTGTVDANVKIDLVNTYLPDSLTFTLSQAETEDGLYTEIVSKTNVPKSNNPITEKLVDKLTIPVGKTYYYNLVITLNDLLDVDQSTDINAKFSSLFSLEDINYKEPTFAEILIAKANNLSITDYTTGNQHEMYTFSHEPASQTSSWTSGELRDYRYIGSNPNNWIKFNDEDWRIIGIFTTETASGNKERLIKIIRNESLGNLAWDSNNINEWSTSRLKTLLNGDYYNQSGSYASAGLSTTARSQIEEVKWYLGGSSTYQDLGGPDYYSFERGETTCVTTGACSGQTRTTNTLAKVGIMYSSDYIYTYGLGVDNTCYTNGYYCKVDKGGIPTSGWLFSNVTQWVISPNASSSQNAFHIGLNGNIGHYLVNELENVYPVVYLSSTTQIKSGTGKQDDPYLI